MIGISHPNVVFYEYFNRYIARNLIAVRYRREGVVFENGGFKALCTHLYIIYTSFAASASVDLL